jgi:1-acyl-sn-glycerol-3-phosphate acyltransferase
MKSEIDDRKNKLTFAALNWLNHRVTRTRFRHVHVLGENNFPKSGAFLLIANHTSRWDGLVIGRLLNRPANYMVTPNELKGFQGMMLRAGGSFPADRRLNLMSFVRRQFAKGEPVVIFPEGDIYRDGSTHPFKRGAAKIVLDCLKYGIDLPIVSVAIRYEGDSVWLAVLETTYLATSTAPVASARQNDAELLARAMHQLVCRARQILQTGWAAALSQELSRAS